MKEKRNIKNIFQIVFTFFAFFIFGAINVNAKTVTVTDKDTFINEFRNKNNTSDIVQLNNDIDMSDINYEQQLYIYKDKTIDLKGKTLILPNRQLSIQYNANATVKFIDSSSGKTGKILGADNSTGDYPLIKVYMDDSTHTETYLVFDGVKIERKNDVYGYVVGNGTNGTKINKVSFINADITNFYSLNDGREADNFYYENITFRRGVSGRGYLMYSEEISISDVISEDSEIIEEYSNGSFKQKFSNDKKLSEVYTGGNVLKVRYKDGFTVSNVDLNETYGYTETTAKEISIKNRGTSDLQIKNVAVDSSNFTIVNGTQTNLSAGATDTTWKIKAKNGLSKGVYTATITVIDINDKPYTSTVTLTVGAKNLTGLGIGGVNSTITYGESYTPTLTGTTELSVGDYEVKYAKKVGESYQDLGTTKPTDVGEYKVTISVTNENYTAADVSVDFKIVAKTITPTIENIDDVIYTGEDLAPNIVVKDGSTNLEKDTDYTVEYADNKNVGTAKVTIKPVSGSNYTFANEGVEKTFNIVAKELTDSNVTLNPTSFRKTGSEIKPLPEVKDGEKTLELGTDYELSYDNNINVGNSAKVKVIGKGNYKGEVTINFSIIDKEPQIINFDEALVTKTYGDSSFKITANHTQGNGTVKYTSSNTDVAEVNEATGKVTIKNAGTVEIKATASATTDYAEETAIYTLKVEKKELSYTATVSNKVFDNNKTATVSGVTFTGLVGSESLTKDTDYTVTAEFASANVGNDLDVNVKVILKDTDKAKNYNLTNANYVAKANITGKAIEESWVTVDTTTTYTYNGSNIEPVVTVKDPTGSTTLTLTKGTHYTVEYTNNLNAGTATVKVTGIGNYAGLIKKDFTINKKSITPTIENIAAVTYNGNEHTPELVVKDGSTTLVKGTDYTVKYTNNLRAGNAYAEITEVSSSNYTFTSAGKDFTINKYEIKASDVTLEYSSIVFDNNAKKPGVTVKMGSEVIPPIEYNVDYLNNTNVGTATVKVTIKTDSDDFTGEVTKNFEIVSKTLLTISGINDQQVTYTGSPVQLVGTLQVSNGINPSSLTEKWYKGTTEISKPTNVGVYKVVYSYEDDTYMGSKTINVEITKKTSTIPSVSSYKGVVGDKLSTITLPNGFKWVDSNEEIIAGNKEYSATYTTNNDEANYTTETTVIEVYGKSKVNLNTSVNGLGGTISSSKTNILEGTTETITFTPNTGFEISKVEVNGVDKTSSVTNNKIDVVIDNNDVSVVVTYKVIQYTITINGVANATIDPSGVIKVDYNTNKEFTIKADQGYKLVSVKVNGVERISDIVNDKLTLENILADAEVVVVVEKNVYEVIEGANQKYTITKNNEAKFRIDADYIKFENGGKVYVDDVLVDPSNYTSESGSTIITLKKEFVDKLSAGDHTLRVEFTDGEATTMFTIAKLASEENPKTGDNIGFYILTGIISTLGLAGAGTYIYRRKQTN